MKTMSYTESRANYAKVLDDVVNDREEIIITRAGHESVVIVSLEEYESLKETAYLLRSPANARRLFDSINRLEANQGSEHSLIEDIDRNGNEGIGKPEPLKHGLSGYWSRRITDGHRLVHKATESEIRIASCRYHYG